ncbi:nucleoporin [Tieghemostelium lacteum]|uniref:Nucleoporin n=1 Tax=Tieghemostelium lacteum TaxID=361077 RepID=A0A152A2K0_TIELA|nr:nucleoporin [Tieghemostelium lacteum]|eukprot:KYR00482.1 nucleoporin [Tieghemostelium lacteum]
MNQFSYTQSPSPVQQNYPQQLNFQQNLRQQQVQYQQQQGQGQTSTASQYGTSLSTSSQYPQQSQGGYSTSSQFQPIQSQAQQQTNSSTTFSSSHMYPTTPQQSVYPQNIMNQQPQMYPNLSTQDTINPQQGGPNPQPFQPLQQQGQQQPQQPQQGQIQLQDLNIQQPQQPQQGQLQPQQQQQQQQQQNEGNFENFNKEAEIQKLLEISIGNIKHSLQNELKSPMPTVRKLDPSQNYNDSHSISTMTIDKMIAFPAEITQRLVSTPTVSALFGIYPEITRIWLVIDNVMYLWNYISGKFTRFNISHVVNQTLLMAPKKDVFSPQVQKMIVFCTFAEIFLNPILFSDEDQECEITLGLSIPTDGISITAIVGTKDGRIYFAGDGYIYEIEYSRNSLSYLRDQKIRKTNRTSSLMSSLWQKKKPEILQLVYDEVKNYLYALSADNKVTCYQVQGTAFTELFVFEPVRDWNSLDSRLQYTQGQQQLQFQQQQMQFQQQQQQRPNNIQQQQQQQQLPPNQQAPQQKIKVDALSVHLTPDDNSYDFMVVLTNGTRMYFNVQSSITSGGGSGSSQYIYLRIPPNSMLGSTSAITSSFYSKGVFLTSAQYDDTQDRVTGVTLFNLSQIKKTFEPSTVTHNENDNFCEKPNFFSVSGRIIEIKEEVNPSYNNLQVPYYYDLMVEHTTSPRRFLLLTSHGLHIVTKLRYVDILENLIADNRDVTPFINEIGQTIGLSLFIELYCQNPKSTILAKEHVGGMLLPKTISSRVADITLAYINRNAGQARPASTVNSGAGSGGIGYKVDNEQYAPSQLFTSLYSYTGRVLSIFWGQPLAHTNGQSRWTYNQLKTYQNHILSLLSFLEITSKVPPIAIPSSDLDIFLDLQQVSNEQQAFKKETRALIGLREVLLQIVQILNLFIIFQEDAVIKPDYFSIKNVSLSDYLFSDYVEDKHVVIKNLINSYLQKVVEYNHRVDIASNRLSQECPNFYRKEDKEYQNAKTYLAEAKKGINVQYNISLAIDILNRIAPHYEYEKVVAELKQLRQMPLITPLLLHFAKQLELTHPLISQKNLSQNDQNQQNQQNQQNSTLNTIIGKIEQKQMEIYAIIIQLLNDQSNIIQEEFEKEKRPKLDIGYTVAQVQAQQLIEQIIGYCLSADTDKKLLWAIYQWIITQNGQFKLMDLDFNSPYLVEFLRDKHPELCWKFLQKNNQNIDASQVLCHVLAESSRDIDKKIGYYRDSLMVLNDQQDTIQYQESKFLYFLATTQRSILTVLETMNNNRELESTINNLKEGLLGLTDLFEIAKNYLLHEHMLVIANYGNHDDTQFFKILWKIIIDDLIDNYHPAENFDGLSIIISEKIVKYGCSFYPNEISFPLQYIINYTEHRFYRFCTKIVDSQQYQTLKTDDIPRSDWLARSLHNAVKIDYWILVDIYKNIIEQQNSQLGNTNASNGDVSWKSASELNYIITVFLCLMESLINSTSTSYTERRLFASKQFRSTVNQFAEKLKAHQDTGGYNNYLSIKFQKVTSMLQALENSY